WRLGDIVDSKLGSVYFDFASGESAVNGVVGASEDFAADCNDGFGLQASELTGEGFICGIEDDLGKAFSIAKIDK
ncbi:uncharacterized protein METZ01_LOCUS448758, partial [marine metagenome]